jgi:hypothetical protein
MFGLGNFGGFMRKGKDEIVKEVGILQKLGSDERIPD